MFQPQLLCKLWQVETLAPVVLDKILETCDIIPLVYSHYASKRLCDTFGLEF